MILEKGVEVGRWSWTNFGYCHAISLERLRINVETLLQDSPSPNRDFNLNMKQEN